MTRTVMDPGERRRELLACAMRLFAEEGYDNVSVRAVARAADDLAHNVSPQLALEAMLLSIKEALACPPSSR